MMKTSATSRTVPFPRRHANRAITLLEVLVVIAIVVVLIGMLLPIKGPRDSSKGIRCMSTLKSMGIGFWNFAADHNDHFPQQLSTNEGGTLECGGDTAAHFRVLSNELASPKMLVCPADSIAPAASFAPLTASNISYFIGMEAKPTKPMMVLVGDDNLTTNGVSVGTGWLIPRSNLVFGYGADRHFSRGFLLMSDGHAEGLDSARLTDYLRQPPNLTNRFLLP